MEKRPNWFERHLNWTAGIFGHLFVFLILFLYYSPVGAWGLTFVLYITERLAKFRTPEYGLYHELLELCYLLLAFSLYFSVNFWYLRMKKQSLKLLWWLMLPFSIIFGAFIDWNVGLRHLMHIEGMDGLIVNWVIWVLIAPMQIVWFGLVAFILLRLKNNSTARYISIR